jgi:hypothetical protein
MPAVAELRLGNGDWPGPGAAIFGEIPARSRRARRVRGRRHQPTEQNLTTDTNMHSLLPRSLLLLLSTWLLALLAVPTVAQTRAAKAPPAVVDQLPVGRVWRGTDDSGAAMTVTVVARNVAGKTARLRVKANNGWTFEVDVITENGGSTFRVRNARRVDQRVRITREGGGGRASKTEIAFGLTWTYDRGHRHGQNEKKIQARR